MSSPNEPRSRDEIQRAFTKLLETHEAQSSLISTKAEEAEQLKDRAIVERASGYTVESIVNSLAKLQLSFGAAVEQIAEQLGEESGKLGEMRRSIEVEKKRLARLRSTIVAAEALAILKRDHEQKLAAFEAEAEAAREELREEMATQREEWQREQEEYDASVAEYQANQDKERSQAAEDHAYDTAREDKVRGDDNDERRRTVERELADEEGTRAKEWAGREKVLADAGEEIEKLRTEVAGFEAALDEARQKARDKAIAAVNRDAKFEAEMLEKEQNSNVKVYELRVQTLEDRIKRQSEQITELASKLDATIAKSQNLAEQAFRSPSRSQGE